MNCVITGTGVDEMTYFPREAMKNNTPYPFGLDPVHMLSELALLHVHVHVLALYMCMVAVRRDFNL